MKQLIPAILVALALGGCTNYFSNYRSVYRIETTTGTRYYSDSKPNLNTSAGTYRIEDLDGNEYEIKQNQIHTIQKYKHRK